MAIGGMMMTDAEQTHAAVKAFYLALQGKTEEGWQAVAQDPKKFNLVWRLMLRLPGGDMPPGYPDQSESTAMRKPPRTG